MQFACYTGVQAQPQILIRVSVEPKSQQVTFTSEDASVGTFQCPFASRCRGVGDFRRAVPSAVALGSVNVYAIRVPHAAYCGRVTICVDRSCKISVWLLQESRRWML